MSETPKLLTEAEWHALLGLAYKHAEPTLRERGLIAPEPVDPLAEELRKAYAEAYRTLPTQNDPTFVAFVAACRARSVTLNPEGVKGKPNV